MRIEAFALLLLGNASCGTRWMDYTTKIILLFTKPWAQNPRHSGGVKKIDDQGHFVEVVRKCEAIVEEP